MRAALTLAALTAAVALLVTVTGAGADSEDPAALAAADSGPRHQLLGSWKLGRTGKVSMRVARSRVSGRVTREVRLAGCDVPARVTLLRSLRFVRRELQSDVWVGRLALPDRDRDCRRRLVPARVRVGNDLRARVTYRDAGDRRTLRLRRIRPSVRDRDPIVGVWERRGVGIRVQRRGDAYIGVARDAFLLSNNCTVDEGVLVWRLRPSAPDRYDGQVQTFMAPPDCDPGAPAGSRWRLVSEDQLVREAPDGSLTEYVRAAD